MRIGIVALIILISLLLVAYLLYTYANSNVYGMNTLLNKFFGLVCTDPVVFDPKDFAWSSNFRDNWEAIRDEFMVYDHRENIPLHGQVNTYTGMCDAKKKWRTLFLRAYGVDTNLANKFPLVMKLINECPCTLAFFSILEPGAKLTPHVGIYKGVIRYHLGLVVPTDRENCFLTIDNKRFYWSEGQDLMFDDTFTHSAENRTNEERIVLFLDIKRDFNNAIANLLNTIALRFISSNDALTDTLDNINSFSLGETT